MQLPFFKLQGTGNDFVAIDNRNLVLSMAQLKAITPAFCHRRTGIGADGILALFPPEVDNSSYTMVYLNADGSDAGMCGNGGRCIARLAHFLGFDAKHTFNVRDQRYLAEVSSSSVTLHLPAEPVITFIQDDYFGEISVLNTGTEHVCIKLDRPEKTDHTDWIREKGKELRYDVRFSPSGTNVNFYYPTGKNSIKMITYERGVEDLTLSCGTGALASSITHALNESMENVSVECPGGILTTSFVWNPNTNSFNQLTLTGAADIVYHGEIEI